MAIIQGRGGEWRGEVDASLFVPNVFANILLTKKYQVLVRSNRDPRGPLRREALGLSLLSLNVGPA